MIEPAAINLAIAARISNGLRFRSTASSSMLKGDYRKKPGAEVSQRREKFDKIASLQDHVKAFA
jgi:hypothetical protein